jgi:hypothetical protein
MATNLIESICIDTLTSIQERKYTRNSKKPTFDQWFDYGSDLPNFTYQLQDIGFELVLVAGLPGLGKSYSMKFLTPQTNIWINCDNKNVPWSGEPTCYGTKTNRTRYHKFFTEYDHIINFLEGGKKNGIFAENPVAFLMGHTEIQKDGTYRLKTIGKMASRMNIEGNFENCLIAEALFEEERPTYRFRTVTSGLDFARTREGVFEDVYIDNNLQLVKERIRATL